MVTDLEIEYAQVAFATLQVPCRWLLLRSFVRLRGLRLLLQTAQHPCQNMASIRILKCRLPSHGVAENPVMTVRKSGGIDAKECVQPTAVSCGCGLCRLAESCSPHMSILTRACQPRDALLEVRALRGVHWHYTAGFGGREVGQSCFS